MSGGACRETPPPLLRWAGAQGPAGSQAGQEQGLEAFFLHPGQLRDHLDQVGASLTPPPPPLFFLYPLKISPGGKTRVRLHCKTGAALLMAFLKKKKKTHTASLWGSLDPTPLPTQPPSSPCNTPPPPRRLPCPGGGSARTPQKYRQPAAISAWPHPCLAALLRTRAAPVSPSHHPFI